jgi:hypothetical protein
MPFTLKLLPGLLFAFSLSLQADTLSIPGHYDSGSSMQMPKRGSSMQKVLEKFGEPVRRGATVGNPPITEWDYGDFRVFFEYQTVLHSLNLTTLIMPKQ